MNKNKAPRWQTPANITRALRACAAWHEEAAAELRAALPADAGETAPRLVRRLLDHDGWARALRAASGLLRKNETKP
ncbi:MAG: hypothetical protein LBC18_15385 [Opitutaceae bacterium]|jgi:hypothetical protein|nr:hypothetical protein [Opitutaceae bacterium]